MAHWSVYSGSTLALSGCAAPCAEWEVFYIYGTSDNTKTMLRYGGVFLCCLPYNIFIGYVRDPTDTHIHIRTHAHAHIYIYIYIERERERESLAPACAKDISCVLAMTFTINVDWKQLENSTRQLGPVIRTTIN